MPFIEAPVESAISAAAILSAFPVWLVQVKYRDAIGRIWTGKKNEAV